ncbi:MAG: Uma2 family endonuclease [Pseudanabaena sp. ELA645]|jgi:Uma2 family endonuclease
MIATIEKIKTNDNHLILTGISWFQFAAIEATFADIEGVRFAYLDGILEIMTLSQEHEDTKCTIGLLLEAYLRESGIRFYKRGSATLGNKQLNGRKEPDESYNLITKKAVPDLVIEVILTSGSIDLLQLYQRIGIPEIWLWEDGVLDVYHLNKSYQKVERSELFPDLDLNIISKYIIYHDQYDAVTEFIRELKK